MKNYKSYVGRILIIQSILSVIITASILTVVSTKIIYRTKYNDTKNLLSVSANQLIYSYSIACDSDFSFSWKSGILYLGDYAVNDDYKIVDDLKEAIGVDLSLFHENTRIVTTLRDDNDERLAGLNYSDMNKIWEKYCSKKKDFFDDEINIGGKSYFGYYVPVIDKNYHAIGMVFAGIPSAEFQRTIRGMNLKIRIICIFLCIAMICTSMIVYKHINSIQNEVMMYVSELDKGNFDCKMPEKILKRKDEYGDMSRNLVQLNKSMLGLIKNDGLTGMLNRRAAMMELNKYVVEANQVDGTPFTFAIGDIDYFKKVNDTYGHNCGDEVLKEVAAVLKRIPKEEGFTSRWGGEEFIVVFKGKMSDSLPKLEKILDEIRSLNIYYDDNNVKVTMTFGITEYRAPKKLDWLISNADVLLYKGKENGRNQIVS